MNVAQGGGYCGLANGSFVAPLIRKGTHRVFYYLIGFDGMVAFSYRFVLTLSEGDLGVRRRLL